eukprot:6185768-Pleurochrysis_carterae.AAC.6
MAMGRSAAHCGCDHPAARYSGVGRMVGYWDSQACAEARFLCGELHLGMHALDSAQRCDAPSEVRCAETHLPQTALGGPQRAIA